MPLSKVISEASSFTPSSLLELYTLDGTDIGMTTIYRFINGSNCNYQPVTFNGVEYTPFPLVGEGFEKDGKSSLPKPKITVSNINGFVSALLLSNGNSLDGATVTRQRVFARFIDAVNWPQNDPLPSWVTPDPLAAYAPEPFLINRKITENPQIVSWELGSALEVGNARLPRRTVIGNVCAGWKYRQRDACNYSNAPVADKLNRTFTGSHYGMTLSDAGDYDANTTYNRGNWVTINPTIPQFADTPTVWVCLTNGTVGIKPSGTSSNWVADECSKTCAGCKLRFTTGPLRISAFPGAAKSGWIVRNR